MTVILDASVALRWFVDQPGRADAEDWLRRFSREPDLFVVPDLFRFEVHGALARLQPRRDTGETGWAERCFERIDRLGIRTVPTTTSLFGRALKLSRELAIAGYDAVYIAHAEDLRRPWLTADERVLRRLTGDERVLPLGGLAST